MSTIVQARPVDRAEKPSLPKADSCVLVIFGATGDLTKRKLMPALYDLACAGCMRAQFEIVGVGRTELNDEQFRTRMREATANSKESRNFHQACWNDVERRLFYMRGDASERDFYSQLKARLQQMRGSGSSPNTIFYVSTPASLAAPIVEGIGESGLARSDSGWARIVLEKPFGHDLASARELNEIVARVFDEKDVFRIDHYLGKETVQNILMFRFGNSMFEPVWNRNYIDYVEITAAETLGVENRAEFYEETGALRDMVANHMLQLLALTAMEPPVAFDADSVREQKVQVFRSIRPMGIDDVKTRTVRGQYGAGTIASTSVRGYREEPGVDPHSHTETFAALELYVNNWRWAGVPFYVRAGKRLATKLTEIAVHFKRTPQALFASTPDEHVEPNVITMNIQPNEGISISFGAKRPGLQMRATPVTMDFSYARTFGTEVSLAYETLLLDAMRGDATLFTRRDEVEAEWRIITPIEDAWAQLPPPQFPNYAAGSNGPADAEILVAENGHHWRALTEVQPAA